MVATDPKILTDVIWSYWKDLGIVKPAMTWIEAFQVVQFFLKECEKRGIDPETVDVKMEIDARIGFRENKEHVDEILTLIAPPVGDPDELLRQELERMAKDTEFHILTEKEMEKLARYEGKAERLAKRVDELEAKREVEKRETTETIEKLERELAEAPTIKLKILRDFKEGIVEFRAEQVIETKNRGWALTKIKQGVAEEVTPEVPITPPPPPPVPITPFKGLTKAEEDRIETKFWALLAEKGITPATARGRNYYAMFKDRLETWKAELRTIERAEAIRQVFDKLLPDLIEVIQGLEHERALLPRVAPPPERIIRVGVPPEERPLEAPPELLVYPVEKPKKPISPATFPRAPTSEERAVLWDWFKYEMARLGQDLYRWKEAFQTRLNMPYRTWEGMMKTLQEFIADIEAGREAALIPLLRIPMPWEETKGTEKWRRDAIVHMTSTKLYATMEELIEALAEWGVYPKVTPEEVKEAVKEAWKTKDVWFTSVPREFLESLISQPVD